MTEPLISLKEISINFQERSTLNKIDLDVKQGEIVTLIGPNGAGKTTLVRIALGLQNPDSGTRSITKGLRIGYMPQKLHINKSMPLRVERFLALTNSKSHEITAALSKTGIKYAANSSVQALSGGEQQRVLLARALLNKPHLLVLDEPVQGVDINGQRELYQLITEIRDEQNCSVLMVSHDLHLVMASTDKVVCINQHVCCSGHPLLVRRHPAYLELFGKESTELAVYTHNHDHNHNASGHVVHNHRKGS
ncbi:MAG: zinc ABC transporter ATP-binding protein ZnuC [Candidatus Endonucleobacter sp. (ex Gigantidas childressi)]|nr:zinc ABC transporter ATP-binding protein ZnuC [Candidatus Endonucleobacter sp. (ex Gigantidas childressi)]